MTIPSVGVREAKAMMDAGCTYLDVRSEPEFEDGRPIGAVNIPWLAFGERGLAKNEAFVAQVAERFALDAPLVVGCKNGGRARAAAAALWDAGFRRLSVCAAGYGGVRDAFGREVEVGWASLELPVERGPVAPARR